MDLRAVSRLADAEAASQSKVADRVLEAVRAEMMRFDGWYDPEQVSAMAERVARLVRAGSKQAAGLSDAYLSRVIAEMLGGSPKPAGVIDLSSPLRKEVSSLAQVYARPAETFRYFQSLQLPREIALQYAMQRLDAMVRTDLHLSRREQSRVSLRANRRVSGYRRIVRPYVSEGGTCGLCVAAADRTYHIKDLLPIHDRCRCEVLPIIGDMDPGIHLNSEDLGKLYEKAGDTAAADLKRVRYRVDDHGELGPVLTRKSGPKHTYYRPTGEITPERAAKQLQVMEPSLARLEDRAKAGEDVSQPLQYQRDLVARLRRISAA